MISSSSASTGGLEPEDAKKRTLLRQWLEKRVVECIDPQAACVAAGLREVIPYVVLALLQPHEFQAFLAGKLGANVYNGVNLISLRSPVLLSQFRYSSQEGSARHIQLYLWVITRRFMH